MGRPSVATERRQAIIDATIRTIATHGITGTTMDRIAEESGMSRGHVRHFVGNRDQLLVDVTRAFYYDGSLGETILPDSVKSLDDAMEFLFSPDFTSPGQENAVVLGLVEASRTNPGIAQILRDAYSSTQQTLAALIAVEAPGSPEAVRNEVAYGILTLALGNVFLADLGVPAEQSAVARFAARALLSHATSVVGAP